MRIVGIDCLERNLISYKSLGRRRARRIYHIAIRNPLLGSHPPISFPVHPPSPHCQIQIHSHSAVHSHSIALSSPEVKFAKVSQSPFQSRSFSHQSPFSPSLLLVRFHYSPAGRRSNLDSNEDFQRMRGVRQRNREKERRDVGGNFSGDARNRLEKRGVRDVQSVEVVTAVNA